MRKTQAVGFIEAIGLPAAIAAADAAVKAANVKLVGRELTKGGGYVTIKIMGDVGAVKAALAAAKVVSDKVHGTQSVLVIPRPAAGIADTLIWNTNAETMGVETDEDSEPSAQPEAPKAEPVVEAETPVSEPEPEIPEPTPEPENSVEPETDHVADVANNDNDGDPQEFVTGDVPDIPDTSAASEDSSETSSDSESEETEEEQEQVGILPKRRRRKKKSPPHYDQ